jgi:hypothetical protein
MTVRTKLQGLLAIVGMSAIFSGCSGSGGGDDLPTPDPVPTASLSASASSVASGGSVQLTWTSANATACAASGNWSGSKATAGTETISNITAASTYSLVCSTGARNSGASSVTISLQSQQGAVSGRVTFARIPFFAATNQGLNFAASAQQPARGIRVHARNATTQAVIGTTTTDANGNYSINVPNNTDISIQAEARMVRDSTQALPRWDVRVYDADAGTSNYIYTGPIFSSGTGVTHDLAIPSGLNNAGAATGTRHSAPFAILDTLYVATQALVAVAPTIDFPALVVDWAANNPAGQTFFSGADERIVLSADLATDTDEYDPHVIAHEFGHYIEFNFSRADNIGGSHGGGDRLDPRVAFGEGFGYAFAAIVLNDPVARDSFVSGGTQVSSTFNVETNNVSNPGWFSEASVWAILWDLHDSVADANDNLALGLAPLWNVLTSTQRNTNALTTVFSFIDALKDARPADAAAINQIVGGQSITSISDEFGTGEMNFGGVQVPASSDILPIYTTITAGGASVTLRSSAPFGTYNTIGNHRFLRLVLPNARNTSITVTSSGNDPDLTVLRQGDFISQLSAESPGDESTGPFNAPAGTYILDVYECANGCTDGGSTDNPGPYDVTITVN